MTTRFGLIYAFVLLYLGISFILRCIFLIWNFAELDHSGLTLVKSFLLGLFFDVGTVSFFASIASVYYLVFPKKWYGNPIDRLVSYLGFSIAVLLIYFSFFAEITFWEEFQRRFNFIAVDYLIYTYEVVKNINESYPLPILIGSMLVLVTMTVFWTKKQGVFKKTFKSNDVFRAKLGPSILFFSISIFFTILVRNEYAEFSANRFNNELAKTGIYSFFAAFRNNELSYTEFYRTISLSKAFNNVHEQIQTGQDSLYGSLTIKRKVNNQGDLKKPNVVLICVESLSAKYLGVFGNKNHLTPTLDSLSQVGYSFDQLFATGTRTVRGMEAISLSIPPTPGRSIVKRNNNSNLFTVGEVFRAKGYKRTFFYGGDGYFDNMDKFFSGNGFDIVDRGRGFLPSGDIVTSRNNIEDEEVTFENAWGVCDEDIYNKVLKEADVSFHQGKPFFDFIMTTSNHKPYTYPVGKIDIPSGSGRDGAIKYTDFAIHEFMAKAKKKPWFKDTVFVIIADHCASSAGRWELDVDNYHIPAMMFNLNGIAPRHISIQCSQIDIFPTLFATLGWDYESNLFGRNIFTFKENEGRALIGNYRKLGLLKGTELMVLGDGKNANFYHWNKQDNSLVPLPMDNDFLEETISYFQVADQLYHNNGLSLNTRL
jgi:phosphoglycerol transferase MdoB-like AlkP superfamily enzyme